MALDPKRMYAVLEVPIDENGNSELVTKESMSIVALCAACAEARTAPRKGDDGVVRIPQDAKLLAAQPIVQGRPKDCCDCGQTFGAWPEQRVCPSCGYVAAFEGMDASGVGVYYCAKDFDPCMSQPTYEEGEQRRRFRFKPPPEALPEKV